MNKVGFYVKASTLSKAKYTRREGTPGHYKYWYTLQSSKDLSKDLSKDADYHRFMLQCGYQKKIDFLYKQNPEAMRNIAAYSGNRYINIRNKLLNREYDAVFMGRYKDDKEGYDKFLDTTIAALDSYIKMCPLVQSCTLWRGFSGDTAQFKEGVEFDHVTFGSFSTNKDLTQSASRTNMIFKWDAPKGALVAPALRRINDEGVEKMRTNDEEKEFLLARGQRFKVISTKQEGEFTIVEIRQVEK